MSLNNLIKESIRIKIVNTPTVWGGKLGKRFYKIKKCSSTQ